MQNENDTSFIPLLSVPCQSSCDSDFDLLMDEEEVSLNLDPYFRDFDGDLVGDGIESKFNTNPGTWKSTPLTYTFDFIRNQSTFDMNITVGLNHEHLRNLVQLEYHVLNPDLEIDTFNYYSISNEEIFASNFLALSFTPSGTSISNTKIYVTYHFSDGIIFSESFGINQNLRIAPSKYNLLTKNFSDESVYAIIALVSVIIMVYYLKYLRGKKSKSSDLYPLHESK